MSLIELEFGRGVRLRISGPDLVATVMKALPRRIPVPSGVRVWMGRGMNGLALQVQQALKHDPHAGDLFVFRGLGERWFLMDHAENRRFLGGPQGSLE